MKENEDIKQRIDEAEKELRELFKDLIYEHCDNEGEYQLNNLASGFNTLLKYARKWHESQEEGLTAAEAIDALLEGKAIRRKTWDKGQYARLSNRCYIVNQNGDRSYLPLIECVECGRSFGASSYNQAQELRSELCPKLWEEYDQETDKEGKQE